MTQFGWICIPILLEYIELQYDVRNDNPMWSCVGLSICGSRRINGKFVGDSWWFVFVVVGVGWQDESWGTRVEGFGKMVIFAARKPLTDEI